MAKVATLQEVRTHYDIVEVHDANEALDIVEEAERRAMEQQARTR